MASHRTTLVAAGLLSLLPLFCYLLLGDLAWSLKERAVQEVVKAKLREVSQDAVLLNVLFGALPAALALLFGPLVGAWSDRTRTAIGRRIPFLLVCAPLISLSLVGLAYSEPLSELLLAPGAAPAARRQAAVICIAFFWGLFELFTIVSNSLFLALINDTVPRPMLGRFFGLFRIVSLGVGASFFYFVFGNDLPHAARNVLLAIAVVFLLGFLILCAGVREPAYPPPAPSRITGLGRIKAPRGEAPWFFLLLFLALGIATVCLMPVNINSYNAISQFGVDRTGLGHAIALTYCISILLAWPLGWLADRVHPLRIGLVMLTLYAFAMLCAWFLVKGKLSFQIWFVVHGVLAGAFLTGTAALLPSVLPSSRFSELAAFSTSVTALLAMLLTPLVGAIIDWSGRDFRLIFLASGMTALVGAGLWFIVLRMHTQRQRKG